MFWPSPHRGPDRTDTAVLSRSHHDRVRRVREFARVARTSLDDDQVAVLTERLLARLRTLQPISPAYSRFRVCVAELNEPTADAVTAELLGLRPGMSGGEHAHRIARRGLRRAIDTYTPGAGADFRTYATTVIADEARRLARTR
ncbi:hypothetical protein [Yinghuangia seranimata]|uniref:hypothetical protein n=1 Tax=Yinghuangia seranimata TaxID=408067 RepID=UPI00248A9A61|nr:hypothetical protein [Yinghuangia seranimata]MDI2125396.1 hypothetical protein [Yinghuangia seranimata]